MNPSRLNELPAGVLSEKLAAGGCTPVDIAEACLERIRARDSEVQAWAYLDPAAVLEQARARANEPRRSPLHGIPVGVKDIMHTHDMPTEYGSPIYRAHRTAEDAACVALLRRAGCVILGKTETMEFAVSHPARTRNPRDPAHTPGGSSSGSAAAVADCMTPLALGTQTGGSIIRPASYCGVVGYKASYRLISRAGIKPASDSLDTVGTLTRTVHDAALLASVLIGVDAGPFRTETAAIRVGICRSPAWKAAQPGTIEAVQGAGARLAGCGHTVREVVLPEIFDRALQAQSTINLYEAFRAFSYERINHGGEISQVLTGRFEQGSKIPLEAYLAAQTVLVESRAALEDVFREVDVLIEPSATGEAPRGLEHAGDAVFNRLWTALHAPCLSLPVLRGPAGLPLGLQVIGPINSDLRLLRISSLLEKQLQPPR